MTRSMIRPPSVPAGMSDGEGPTWRRPSRTVVIVAAVAVIVLAAVAVWVVFFSSVFGVGTVTVDGAKHVSVAQVRAAADIPDGSPLLRLDTGAVAQRVERLPQIASARVSTSFPSTVTITVTERTPVGYESSGGRDVLIDRNGVRYETVATAPHGLPRLVVPSGSAGLSATAAVGQVAGALPASILDQVRSIQALAPNAITLVLSHDRLVHWGSAAQSAAKAEVLPLLLRHGASLVDVTDPQQPFTR